MNRGAKVGAMRAPHLHQAAIITLSWLLALGLGACSPTAGEAASAGSGDAPADSLPDASMDSAPDVVDAAPIDTATVLAQEVVDVAPMMDAAKPQGCSNQVKEQCNGVDDDGDGLIDEGAFLACDDGDVCTKETCSAAKCSSAPYDMCGDGICNCAETAKTCVRDCPETCGDGICNGCENKKFCPADCATATCGDGVCDNGEGSVNCRRDCGAQACDNNKCNGDGGCGDGICQVGEGTAQCPEDCWCSACGNETCEPGESTTSCPVDCGNACGNQKCEPGETEIGCPVDCGFCGDCVCSVSAPGGPDPKNCPTDCKK